MPNIEVKAKNIHSVFLLEISVSGACSLGVFAHTGDMNGMLSPAHICSEIPSWPVVDDDDA